MSKLRVVRLLVYEGETPWVQDILNKSLPDGVKVLAGLTTIKVITLGTLPDKVDIFLPEKEG